jgi:hypothetical protein
MQGYSELSFEDEEDEEDASLMFEMMGMASAIQQSNDLEEEAKSATRFQGYSIRYRRNNSGTIRRKSLQNPTKSVFWKLYKAKQDDSMIQLTGFDHEAFEDLLEIFKPLYDKFTPHCQNLRAVKPGGEKRLGRPRSLDATAGLALVLTWTRTKGGHRVLCLLFGIIKSTCSLWLRFGKRCLIKCLRKTDEARVRLPNADEVDELCKLINNKYENLTRVWAAMDGLKVMLQQAGNAEVQSMFYNGWMCDHYISNLFLFSPNGRICACYFNAPGSVHDSTMAEMSGIYDKIDSIHQQTGGQVVVDSAFSKKGRPSLIKSNQNNIDNQGRARQLNTINREATSVRQLSEWGMRGLQGAFPRLADRVPFEERGERKQLLQLVVLLFNYRTEKVGFNQIQTVFTGILEKTPNDLITEV